ncbi:MAG: NACHT domain-containing protein [Solirubrobacteraceae bacterium]
MIRTDETWHRLREWTYGQALSERLASQVLQAEGFSGIDPSHPLGGPDEGRDGVAVRDGQEWLFAVYFPRGRRPFGEVKRKLTKDARSVARHRAAGIALVTNQELTLSQRADLCAAISAPVELFHLERLAAILDRPGMYGVREQYLKIPAPTAATVDDSRPTAEQLEVELREMLVGEYGLLSTRGLPRDLRRGEPRLPMKDVFVPLRVEPPVPAEILRDALANISYRERRVLELRLGLGNEKPRSHAEIGVTFHVSAERVAEIEAAALERIAETLQASAAASVAHGFDATAIAELVAGMNHGIRLFTALDNRLVALGGPGSGKSTVTRYLTWAAALEEPSLPGSLRKKLAFRVSSSEFARALEDAPVAFFEFVLKQAGRFAPALRRAHEQARLLLILDGLDEVSDLALAEEVNRQINRFLRDRAFVEVAMLLTSRIVGYHPEGALAELPTVTLAPLNPRESKRFLSGWFAQLDGLDAGAMSERLFTRLQRDARMAEFASTPLLLTVLALLQARGQRLPNERAQLYAAATETLIHSWPQEQRASNLSYDTIPRWLAPLAGRAFLTPSELGVPEEEVVEILSASWQALFGGAEGDARQRTRELLQALSEDAGLLSVTGHSPEGARLWDFLHRSFAEYLVARERADAYLSREEDPLSQIHDERWREVALMTLGELGRRRLETVGPLLERLCAMRSTPWEPSLQRDLRLALTALSHDVPCEQASATALLDRALEAWAGTAIAPLRGDLAVLFRDLRETRYASMLVARAELLTLTREQRLELGSIIDRAGKQSDLLAALLSEPDEYADQAAIAMLEDKEPAAAIAYLHARLAQIKAPMGLHTAEMLARHDHRFAVAELVRRVREENPPFTWAAAQALTRVKGRTALSGMEALLDLYPDKRLEPLLEHLSQGGAAIQARLFELARKPGSQRLGALSVLHRMRAPGVEEMLEALSDDKDFQTRLLASQLRGMDVTELAVEALSEPENRRRLWAARTLIADAQHAGNAHAVLEEVANSLGEPAARVSALEALIAVDAGSAFKALAALLAQTPDAALRRRIVELLRANLADGARDALVAALANADPNVVGSAAEALLSDHDQRAVSGVIGAAIDGRLDVGRAVWLLSEAPGLRLTRQTAELIVSGELGARRLAARLLSRIDSPEVTILAEDLIDDADATVRCGAIWALVISGTHDELLLARLGHLLADKERIIGPPVEDGGSSLQVFGAQPVRCCADAAYRLVEATPSLLADAPATA